MSLECHLYNQYVSIVDYTDLRLSSIKYLFCQPMRAQGINEATRCKHHWLYPPM